MLNVTHQFFPYVYTLFGRENKITVYARVRLIQAGSILMISKINTQKEGLNLRLSCSQIVPLRIIKRIPPILTMYIYNRTLNFNSHAYAYAWFVLFPFLGACSLLI